MSDERNSTDDVEERQRLVDVVTETALAEHKARKTAEDHEEADCDRCEDGRRCPIDVAANEARYDAYTARWSAVEDLADYDAAHPTKEKS